MFKIVYCIIEIMQIVIIHGTGKWVRVLGRSVVGKIGTIDDGIDTWFVGYILDLVVSVWVGFDDRCLVKKAIGGRIAVLIWIQFMIVVYEGVVINRFRVLRGVELLSSIGQMVVVVRTLF